MRKTFSDQHWNKQVEILSLASGKKEIMYLNQHYDDLTKQVFAIKNCFSSFLALKMLKVKTQNKHHFRHVASVPFFAQAIRQNIKNISLCMKTSIKTIHLLCILFK